MQPTHVKFLEQRVLGAGGTLPRLVVATREEASYVGVEIGITSQGEAQAGGNLVTEVVPCGLHVTAPGVRAGALLPGIRRAGEHHRTAVRYSQLFLRHTFYGEQRVRIQDAAVRPHTRHLFQIAVLVVEVIRLSGVHPPAVYAHLLKTEKVVPVNVARFGAESVIRQYA